MNFLKGLLLVKVSIIYGTMYGNTRLVAEKIVEEIREVERIKTIIEAVEKVDLENVVDSDAILIGTPNHMGEPTQIIKKLIDDLGKTDLKAKWVAVFDTYLGGDLEKATKKMEKRISVKIPGVTIMASGLSIKVKKMKGPIEDGELFKCKDFGRIIADKIKS